MVAKNAIEATNIGHVPIKQATPNVTITHPRYMGLRVNL